MSCRILVTEDHPLFRSALCGVLEQCLDALSLTEARDFDSLKSTLEQELETPDLILLDLQIPGAQGYSCLLWLRNLYPEIPVIVISAKEEAAVIRKCCQLGASGFIPKSAPLDTISQAVRHVLDGGIWTPENQHVPEAAVASAPSHAIHTLTPQQYRVLVMLRDGLRNKQIAWELGVSEATIKAHATAIFRKLGVNNRTHAVIALQELEAAGG